MKIYFDGDCGICKKCKSLCLKLKTKNSAMEFIDMNLTEFKSDVKKTIVVMENGKELRYGAALQVIFRELKFPLNLTGYLPKFILTAFYILLREIRNKYSKICKI